MVSVTASRMFTTNCSTLIFAQEVLAYKWPVAFLRGNIEVPLSLVHTIASHLDLCMSRVNWVIYTGGGCNPPIDSADMATLSTILPYAPKATKNCTLVSHPPANL